MGALLVAAYLDEVLLDQLQNAETLIDGTVRKQLLEEVVSVLVPHNGRKLFTDFMEEELDQNWI